MVVQSSGKHTTLAPFPVAWRARLSAFSILTFLSTCPLNWASATRTLIGSVLLWDRQARLLYRRRGALRKGHARAADACRGQVGRVAPIALTKKSGTRRWMRTTSGTKRVSTKPAASIAPFHWAGVRNPPLGR